MESPFVARLSERLGSIHPDAPGRLEALDLLPGEVRDQVIEALLLIACQAQHVGNIQAARSAFARIPRSVIDGLRPETIETVLNVDDEWEYRRLLELLHELGSDLLPIFLRRGIAAADPDLREAARDFAALAPG